MPKIAIIIPVVNLWNTRTKKCIDSIKTSYEYRILCIDNASVDETKVEAGKLVSDKFSHKRNEERWGCSQSWNYGINDAWDRGFDYVLVLNNDVILHPDCIDRMVERFEKSNSSGNITVEIYNNQHPLVMVTAMDIRGECKTPENIFEKKSKDYEKLDESEHPNFSAFMINKKCWQEVGEFDEGFFPSYFEDNDFHHRIKLAGMKAVTYPPALFYHYGSSTINQSDKEKVMGAVGFENTKKYFIEKWGGVPTEIKFDHPFNNPTYSLKYTKQKPQ
jgi:GT2 family glycosyltransferase